MDTLMTIIGYARESYKMVGEHRKGRGRGAWVAQVLISVRLQPGHDLAVREFKPHVGLCAAS